MAVIPKPFILQVREKNLWKYAITRKRYMLPGRKVRNVKG